MLRAPSVTSKLSRPLFGLIVRVVTWVELRDCSAPDVPLTSPWVSSWVHQGVVATGKTSTYLKAHSICHPISPPPPFLSANHHLSAPPLYPRLAPLSTPGGLKKISPAPMPQEPATSQPIISPNLWSMLPAVQVTVTSLSNFTLTLTLIVLFLINIAYLDMTAVLSVGDG